MGIGLFKCLRCEHEWASKQSPPYRCPHCKSLLWATSKMDRPPMIRSYPQRRKYPINEIKVGETRVLSWTLAPNGEINERISASMNRAVVQEEERYGKKFIREGTPRGLKVIRIA